MPWGEVEILLPNEVLVHRGQKAPIKQGWATKPYDIGGNAENMNKRPFGPPAWPYRFVDKSRNRDDAFANNDQSEKAHADVQVSVLESELWGDAGGGDHHPHLNPEYHKPNSPNVGRRRIFLEGEIHLSLC